MFLAGDEIPERDAARKDLEMAVAAMWFAWPLVAGPGVDPAKLLNVIGTGDSPMRRYAKFLAAHPVKPPAET